MKIKGITLLSVEEYEKYKDKIKPIKEDWWLCSQGEGADYYTAYVHRNSGSVNIKGYDVDCMLSVRPALIIEYEDKKQVSETFGFGDNTWTLISDYLALTDEPLRRMPFRENWTAPDANDYKTSDIKKYLNEWLSSKMIEKENITFDSSAQRLNDWQEDIIKGVKLLQKGCAKAHDEIQIINAFGMEFKSKICSKEKECPIYPICKRIRENFYGLEPIDFSFKS